MAELLLNADSCSNCSLCIAACPMNIIRMQDGEFPHFTADGAERCIVCGHCEAICPSGSIRIEDPRLDPVVYPVSGSRIEPACLGEHIRMRRSIRRYKDTPVDRVVVEKLMDVVRYAPTGTNSQQVRWLIIHDTAELRKLTALAVDWMRSAICSGSPLSAHFNFAGMVKAWEKGKDPICRNAPHLVIAYASREARSAPVDGIIALSTLDIVAPAYGVGTCWCGFFQYAMSQWEPLRSALGLEEDQVSIYAMMLGYPAVSYRRPPRRNRINLIWR